VESAPAIQLSPTAALLLQGILALVLVCGFGTLFRVDAGSRRDHLRDRHPQHRAGPDAGVHLLPGQTGMMLVLGLWGIWRLVSGGLLAWFWPKRPA